MWTFSQLGLHIYGYYWGTCQLCLRLDVGRPHVVMYVLLLFSIVSISPLLMVVY